MTPTCAGMENRFTIDPPTWVGDVAGNAHHTTSTPICVGSTTPRSKAMQAKHCADGCCPDCGRFFAEEHPQAMKKLANELATWRVYLEDE